jgi:hypothetical protein
LKFVAVFLALIISLAAIGSPCPSAQAANNTAEVNLTANVVSPLSVTTNDAGRITVKGATLNGRLDNLGSFSSVSVSFVWGTSPGALDRETRPKPKKKAGAFRARLQRLSPNTTYYFRAVAEGDEETAYGDVFNFTTKEPKKPFWWFWWWW